MIKKSLDILLFLFFLFIAVGMIFFLLTNIPFAYGILVYFSLYVIAAVAMLVFFPQIDSLSDKLKFVHGGVNLPTSVNLTIRIALFLFTAVVCGAYAYSVRLTYHGDIQGLLNRSIGLTDGAMHNYRYAALFPHILKYPALVSAFMRIFGKSDLVNIAINQFTVLIAVQLVYSYLKLYVCPRAALAGALSTALNPFIWIFANTPNAELLFGTSALAALYCFEFGTRRRLNIVLVGVSLVLCTVAQYFRPLGIIVLIALLLALFSQSNLKLKHKAFLSAAGISFFLLCSFFSTKLIQSLTDYAAPVKSYGWNLFVGASNSGTWNSADADVFNAVFENTSTTDEVQNFFADKAFERYAEMGAGIASHSFNKLWVWIESSYIMSVAAWENWSRNGFAFGTGVAYNSIIFVYNGLLSFFTAIAIIVIPIKRLKICMPIEPALYFFAGSVLLMMFTEIAARYTIGYRFFYSIFTIQLFAALFKQTEKSREFSNDDSSIL